MPQTHLSTQRWHRTTTDHEICLAHPHALGHQCDHARHPVSQEPPEGAIERYPVHCRSRQQLPGRLVSDPWIIPATAEEASATLDRSVDRVCHTSSRLLCS